MGRLIRNQLHLSWGNQDLNQICDDENEQKKCDRRPGKGGITGNLTGYEGNGKGREEMKKGDWRYPACGKAASQNGENGWRNW